MQHSRKQCHSSFEQLVAVNSNMINSTEVPEVQIPLPSEQVDTWVVFKTKRPVLYAFLLVLVCLLSFVSNTMQGVFFKRMADDIPTGPYFLLVFCSAMFVVVFFAAMFIRDAAHWIYRRLVKLRNGKEVPPVERSYVSHLHLFIIGALDSVNGLILLYAAHPTAAALHPILAQSTIPFTFVFSYVLMRSQFTIKFFCLELLSTVIVSVGVLVSLVPVFVAIASDPSAVGSSAIWPIIFVTGFIPGALMNVVQEKYSKRKENLDYLHLLGWVSAYQILTDAFFFWSNFVVPATNVQNFADLGGMVDKGFGCLVGHEILVNGTSKGNCKMAALDTALFVGGYVGTYTFTALMLKMASSIFYILSNAPVAPMTDVIFFIFGMDKINWATGVAIPIMLVGVIVHMLVDYYKSKTIVSKQQQEETEEEKTHLIE